MLNTRALQWVAIILAVLFVLSLLPVMAVAWEPVAWRRRSLPPVWRPALVCRCC